MNQYLCARRLEVDPFDEEYVQLTPIKYDKLVL